MFFTGCASKNNASQLNTNVSNLPIHQMHASFVYDTDNIREAVGICDYVFVAKVVSCDGTEYRNVITTEDEKGNPKEVGSPYTNYTIQVLENIKGELITDKPIPIVKQGGISENKMLFICLRMIHCLPKIPFISFGICTRGWFVTNFWSKFKCNV